MWRRETTLSRMNLYILSSYNHPLLPKCADENPAEPYIPHPRGNNEKRAKKGKWQQTDKHTSASQENVAKLIYTRFNRTSKTCLRLAVEWLHVPLNRCPSPAFDQRTRDSGTSSPSWAKAKITWTTRVSIIQIRTANQIIWIRMQQPYSNSNSKYREFECSITYHL